MSPLLPTPGSAEGSRDPGLEPSTKLVFVNYYFFPDASATSQLLTDLTVFLAGRGFRVEVVTSNQRCDDPAAALPDGEWHQGVLVHRVRAFRFGRGHQLGRLLDYLSFCWSAGIRLHRIVARGDCVVAKTDPPLISIPAALVARQRAALLINWLQDIFPEVATELGIIGAERTLGRLIRVLRDWSWRQARINVVVGRRMSDLCAARGIAPGAIRWIPNWADANTIRPLLARDNPLRARWGLTDSFVIGYSGNLGLAHEFETLVGAADRLRGQRDLVFLIIGGGALMDALRRATAGLGLHNIRFEPYQPRRDLAFSLTVPDVHLVVLRPPLEGLVVPSKFYGAAAAGRPVLFIGDPEGEIPRLLRDAGAGWTIAPGDADGLAALIVMLRDRQSCRIEAGANARRLLESRFSAAQSLSAWMALLARCQGNAKDADYSHSSETA